MHAEKPKDFMGMEQVFYTICECHGCGEKKVGHDCLPVIEVLCTSCGTVRKLCPDCRGKGCSRCGRKLIPLWVIGRRDLALESTIENVSHA